MQSLPSISIVTCTYTSNLRIFTKVLESIKMQDYPKEKVEHILMDGGSQDGTVAMAQKYGCRIYSDIAMRDKVEERASLGIMKAKHELVIFLENDNILVGKNWLRNMVRPFQENKNIFCTFSAWNTYEKTMPAVTRYCALFGIPDPLLYYLKKTEKIRMDQKEYNKGKVLSETNHYWTVMFNQSTLPTLGDNGHMFRKSAMMTVNINPDTYVHVDAFQELLDKGYNTVGVVKNAIIHTTTPTLQRLVKQRVHTKMKFYDERRGKRKYLTMNWSSSKDILNLVLFIIFSLTFIEPLYESIRGYMKIRDIAWFMHPIACFITVIGYSKSEILWIIKEKK